MRIFLCNLCLFITLSLSAQERCASVTYAAVQTGSAAEADDIKKADAFLQQASVNSRTSAPTIVTIPVVVHILYKDAAQAISDEQVRSQIEVLNRDFRRDNADTLNTPERFRHLAADVQLQFALATADPKGRATTGIVRKQTSVANWTATDKMKASATNGSDAWDSKSYLNIWVVNLVAGAGYSSAPGSDATKDGIVLNASAFGTIGRTGNYSAGRTATHEVGHWLGLKHIWGDAACGDDGIADTPPQSTYTQGCPSGVRSTCTNGANGDMYMNFMDYTADACMNMFTLGQKRRMLAAFADGGPRASLLQSRGLQKAWIEGEEASAVSTITAYPNPTTNDITFKLSADWFGQPLQITTASGVVVKTIQVNAVLQKLNVATLKAGLYFVQVGGKSGKFMKL